ncbi:MAG: ABC transporter substrate-binding protein [Candidatus Hermodarchaeota archaeon]|nr:ABC transporter substrate-binding protein [Candidatus Hermodarchaeota archaeon]
MNKKIIALGFVAVFCCLFVSGVPTSAQYNATPELRYPLWVLSWDDISVATGQGLFLQMNQIGVRFDVTIKDDDPMYEGIYEIPRTFQIYEMSHGYGAVPEHVWWRMHSDNIVDWGSNGYCINNATVDTILDNFMGATPATLPALSAQVQQIAKDNVPYIPLFLSDDTHAIRNNWVNYTMKPGGVFTSFNPQTMIYMYNETNLPDVAERGGEIRFIMAYPSDVGELNPLFYRSERSHWYDLLVYDPFISYDINMDPIPWMAESFNLADDATQLNFTIRAGAVWHDGVTPVTVNDANFTIHYYKDAPVDSTLWPFFQHVTSTEIDGNTLVINLDQPMAFALQMIGDAYILPEHVRGGIDWLDPRWEDETNVTAQMGSGPFIYDSRSPDDFTLVTRNPNWWGPQLPNVESVMIRVVAGQDARILAMRQGTADSERYEVFGAYVNTILSAPELDLVTGLPSQWDYVLGFATNWSVAGYAGYGLEDINVRKAMALAINRQQLVDIGRLGFGTVTNSVIPYEFYPSLYDSAGAWVEDVDAANAMLDAAGYIDVDNDGIREFPGVTVPPPPPNLLLIGIAGVVALVVGMVVVYLIMRMRK